MTTEVFFTNYGPYEEFVFNEGSDIIAKVIESLSILQKEIYLLKEVEGLSVDEISNQLEMNKNAVEVNLSRARKKITKRGFIQADLAGFSNVYPSSYNSVFRNIELSIPDTLKPNLEVESLKGEIISDFTIGELKITTELGIESKITINSYAGKIVIKKKQ